MCIKRVYWQYKRIASARLWRIGYRQLILALYPIGCNGGSIIVNYTRKGIKSIRRKVPNLIMQSWERAVFVPNLLKLFFGSGGIINLRCDGVWVFFLRVYKKKREWLTLSFSGATRSIMVPH